jgi:FixJ family two-component response regulator
MNSAPATVIVVDDDPAVREALQSLMGSVGLRVEAYGSAKEFLANPSPQGPSCLVLDIRLPGKSGLDFQDDMAKLNIALPVIFISGHGDIPMSVRAMKAGAVEFLTKPFRDQDLLDAIQAALEHDRLQRARERLFQELLQRFESLTAREREVMTFVVSGLRNKQIADVIGVSEVTIKAHRGQVMRKMGARSLADLVRMADKVGNLPKS